MFRRSMVMALASVVGIAVIACSGDPEGSQSGLVAELHYVRSGGLAGETFELTIQPDGQAELSGWRGAGDVALNWGETSFTLRAPELHAVVALLPPNFAELPADATGEPAPDAFSHEVSYDGHTVRTTDFAFPVELEPLLDELGVVVETHPLG